MEFGNLPQCVRAALEAAWAKNGLVKFLYFLKVMSRDLRNFLVCVLQNTIVSNRSMKKCMTFSANQWFHDSAILMIVKKNTRNPQETQRIQQYPWFQDQDFKQCTKPRISHEFRQSMTSENSENSWFLKIYKNPWFPWIYKIHDFHEFTKFMTSMNLQNPWIPWFHKSSWFLHRQKS